MYLGLAADRIEDDVDWAHILFELRALVIDELIGSQPADKLLVLP